MVLETAFINLVKNPNLHVSSAVKPPAAARAFPRGCKTMRYM
jgi:hypothetical protein